MDYLKGCFANYWNLAISVFLIILCVFKYNSRKELRDWIEKYINEIYPKKIDDKAEQTLGKADEKIVELEEIQDIIYDFVIKNQEIFSKIKIKEDGCKNNKGYTKIS